MNRHTIDLDDVKFPPLTSGMWALNKDFDPYPFDYLQVLIDFLILFARKITLPFKLSVCVLCIIEIGHYTVLNTC